MKTVVTTLGSFPTGTEIADAVTGYGLALSRARTVDVVDIPYVAVDGSAGRVELQIGWHSETVVIAGAEASEQAFGEEPFEVDTILALQEKTRALHAPPAAAAPFSVHTDQARPVEPDWDAVI